MHALGRRSIVLSALGAAGVFALARVGRASEPPPATPAPPVVIVQPSYAYDVRDPRVLVGISDVVFLGEVVEQVGSRGVPTSDPEDEIPQTQFAVRVMERITGDPPDEVVVSQGSGIDKSTGTLVLLDGDPLLRPGEVVLFAANREPDFGWYTIVAGPYGATRATDAEDADRLVAAFRAAAADAFVPVPIPCAVESRRRRRRTTTEPRR